MEPWTRFRHYDGNSLLFSDDGTDLDSIKIGAYGTIGGKITNLPRIGPPYKLDISDRELDGSLASDHDASGHTGWTVANYFQQPCQPQQPISSASQGYDGGVGDFTSEPNPFTVDDGANLMSGASGIASMAIQATNSSIIAGLHPNDDCSHIASRGIHVLDDCGGQGSGGGDNSPGVISCTAKGSECGGFTVIGGSAGNSGGGDFGSWGDGGSGLGDGVAPGGREPKNPTLPESAKCPLKGNDVGASFGFLIAPEFSATTNGGNLYLTAGIQFTPLAGLGWSATNLQIFPEAGQTATDVLSGYSITAQAGAGLSSKLGIGGQWAGNSSGYSTSSGFMTPAFGGGFVITLGPFSLTPTACKD